MNEKGTPQNRITETITNEFTMTHLREQSREDTITSCWIWTRKLDSKGYGRVRGRIAKHYGTDLVHRVSYQATYGSIGSDIQVRHRCNNRACLNPNHLEEGTALQNIYDKYEALADQTKSSLLNLESRLQKRLNEVRNELSRRS